MLKAERQRRIEIVMRSDHAAAVEDLSQRLNVSVVTVRRDLAEMEELGLVRRVHGGAIPVEQKALPEPPISQRSQVNAEYKRRIGQAAADLVKDGDTIVITSGSTTLELARRLPGKQRITVLTNALDIALVLSAYSEIDVVVVGGYLRHSELSLQGHLAEQALKALHASKVFSGAFALHPIHGLSGDSITAVSTDRALLAAAPYVVVLADHSKLGLIGTVDVAPITQIHTLITDTDATPEQVSAYRALGLEVISA